MPNWCSNGLTLYHKDPAKIETALKAFDCGAFLAHFVPLPESGWEWNFCVNNWGTKWDVGGNDGSEAHRLDEHTAEFSFDSAWSPPIEAYMSMVEQGFEVEAFYYEPGMAFVGKVIGNAENFWDDYREYGGSTSQTVREMIGDELDDYFEISNNMAAWEQDEEDYMEKQRLDSLPPHTD